MTKKTKTTKPKRASRPMPSKRSTAKSSAAHPLLGKRAPEFNLSDANGNKFRLKDLLGHGTLVLYFYPKDMTTGCTKEACDFRDSFKPLEKLNAQVAGVSPDSPESHQKFAARYDLQFHLLSDPDKAAAKSYGVYQKKSLYGREFMGIVRTTFLIDDQGTVRKVFPKVRVEGHVPAVMAAIEELSNS
jgi:peroxiredoxin Q/BCP